MDKPADDNANQAELRKRIIGLGERSARKSYYPQLQEKIASLEEKSEHLQDRAKVMTELLNNLQEARKRAEDNEQFLQTVFDGIKDGLCVLDAEMTVVRVNEWMEQMYSNEQPLVGKKCYEVYHGRDSVCTWCPCARTLKTGEKDIEVVPYVSGGIKDGWIELSSFPIKDAQGHVTGVIEHAKDITERKRHEKEIENLLKTLEQRNEELQSFIYISSHDLRSPLMNLDGFASELDINCRQLAELLEEDCSREDIQVQLRQLAQKDIPEALNYIQANASKMSELLNGLLKFSRVSTMELHSETIDMNQVVAGIVETISYQIQQHDIAVSCSELPPCKADPFMLDSVFVNLIDNAIKYRHPDRTLVLDISGFEEGETCCYCIKDNGIGIEKKHQDKIFSIFYQLESQGPRQGVGLGLAMVKSFLSRLNGGIEIQSQVGEGSRFLVTLPRA